LRPEKIRIGYGAPSTDVNRAQGEVWEIGYLGDISVYKIMLADGFIMKVAAANMTRLVERSIGVGDRVWLSWAADAGVVLTR
jgi:putrescine transport system ATP-binding protein